MYIYIFCNCDNALQLLQVLNLSLVASIIDSQHVESSNRLDHNKQQLLYLNQKIKIMNMYTTSTYIPVAFLKIPLRICTSGRNFSSLFPMQPPSTITGAMLSDVTGSRIGVLIKSSRDWISNISSVNMYLQYNE